jgi:hypothetical protein
VPQRGAQACSCLARKMSEKGANPL